MISDGRSNSSKPALYGLILAGGKSVRMGSDKSVINWHGKEQRYYMADILAGFCKEVFISCRAEQQGSIVQEYKTLVDNYEGAGTTGSSDARGWSYVRHGKNHQSNAER